MVIVVGGIAQAMRSLHSRGIIHCDLKPANVLVEWDWIVRIGDFGHSLLADKYGGALPQQVDRSERFPFNPRYAAPECFEDEQTLTSNVLAFGLILCELVTGQPGFPLDFGRRRLMKMIVVHKARPAIPDSVGREVRELIGECWEENPARRPSFAEILERLDEMDFKIIAGVDSGKVRRFVRAVKDREKAIGIEIED
jgi:serine/threonine protein kinase